MRNLAVIGASDDSLDVDTGAQANVEKVLVVQRANTGDSIVELDSPDDLGDGTPGNAIPQTRFQINNSTFVQRSSASAQAVRARGGAALGLTNTVIDIDSADDNCIRIDETITLNAIIGFDSLVCDGKTRPLRGSSGVSDAQIQAAVTAGTNNNVTATLTLANVVVNGTFENGRTVFAVNPARSSFFTNFAFIGAVQTAIATDFGDWTCNSSILNFGSATGSCTSLPVY